VSSITCEPVEGYVYHIHAHLSIIVDGVQLRVPRRIGIPTRARPPCLYALHTHDGSGIVHIEAPARRSFTLGQFFGIWGMQLTHTQVAKNHGPVNLFVDARRYHGDPSDLPLSDEQLITLEVGQYVAPPSYAFPPKD